MTITSQNLSRLVASVLITLTAAVIFAGIAWEFSGDAPGLVIALGVWVVLVALVWLWLWRGQRSAALRALPIAAAFAPTIVAPAPIIAFPLPASLALPLLVASAFTSPSERLGSIFVQAVLAVLSLGVVWLVGFLVMRRRQR